MNAPRILHYPGSKWSLAEWIISHMPPHTTYLEPFFGSGAVFFNKAPSALETINDIDGDVVNLFKVIRDRPGELARGIKWTPWARGEFYTCSRPRGGGEAELERARMFLVRCWQSIRVKTGSISGWKCRATADDAYRVKQWNELPEKIAEVAERLKQVQIENRPALEVIARYKRQDVLIYADPPYLLGARNGAIYQNEMDETDHAQLLEALDGHPGPVFLSGYDSRLYNDRLKHWRREERQQVIETGQSRTEVLWINPVAEEHAGKQLTLF
ncbi:DNA adenine methylase [Cohnella lubricantis]|uniref:DNA adenine methylase n=1 Tax=Cohnella lubricantis TaxID=2163172 RepID=A0A841T592_9BACL|nr:DNA adenine methylase [Cohnella lubricantis]MBB6676484.1 DNA adenine methylase [Cohnella lubricantis]MBP2117101.1 DNA adenine methylase [Cohnella lubricantis]